MTDVLIIGAGVTGCATARELSRYDASITVLEKGNDVAVGASKANSGIVHAGFDAHPGSVKAFYNVRGAELFPALSKELDFPYRMNGAMVLNFDSEKTCELELLLRQGEENGVKGLKIISGDEARDMEPEISDNVVNALYVPSSGIVSPYEMTIAYAENAATNGVTFELNKNVVSVKKEDGAFIVKTSDGAVYRSKAVINCAGVYSDVINNMICSTRYSITARKGEYDLLDKNYGYITNATLFQLPTVMGKGVLVAPTAHGNILVGPTAADMPGKEDVDTTQEGLSSAWSQANLSVKSLPKKGIITQFAGLRAHCSTGDFVIGKTDVENFYNCLGVESPGLTSAPAIGKDLASMAAKDLRLSPKNNFISKRTAIPHFSRMSDVERADLIEKNPLYGSVVCRCEVITEGEIVEAIHRVPGARDLDGIKRRTRAGMGRCQAGFCTPRIMAILARELGVKKEQITKSGRGSELITED